MRIKPVLKVSWCICLLNGCSSAPTLPEPKGAFFSVNPESFHIDNTLPTKKPAKDNHSMTSKPLTVTKRPQIISVNNNSSPAQENKPLVHSQSMIAPPKTTTLLTNKPLTAMKVTPPLKPVQTWQIEKGVTLKAGVMAWAIKASCVAPGVKNWSVLWQTSVNYPIDAPLRFSGDFKSALRSVLELYQSAKKPLYAETNTPQCLVIVKEGRF